MAREDRRDLQKLVHYLGCLATGDLRRLAEGPLPDAHIKKGDPAPCRVCQVVNEPHPSSSRHALAQLKVWHEFPDEFSEADGFLAFARTNQRVEGYGDIQALDELDGVMGALAHARCLVIYLLAAAELANRDLGLRYRVGWWR